MLASPLRLTDHFVDHSAKYFLAGLMILFIIAITTQEAAGFVSVQQEARRDFLQTDRPEIVNNDKYYLMNGYIDRIEKEKLHNRYNGKIPTRSQTMHTLQIVYRLQNWTIVDQGLTRHTARFDPLHRRRRLMDHTANHNFSKSIKRWGLLEKGSLILIDDIEKDIKRLPLWQKLCLAESETDSSCRHESFLSPIDVLYDRQGNLFLENLNQSEIIDRMDDFLQATKEKQNPWYNHRKELFVPGFFENEQLNVYHLRSVLTIGGPLDMGPDGETYTDLTAASVRAQRELVRKFVRHLHKTLMREFQDDWVEVHFISDGILLDGMLTKRILTHMEDYPGPMIMTGVVLFLRIQNVFVTSCALFLIYCNIWVTISFTRDVFQINYFSQHHAFVLLLACSFAANSIIVFLDAWRQSGQFPPELVKRSDKKARMAYVYRRAVRSICFTSLASFFSFIAACYTPIMPLQALGAWCSVFVVVNCLIVAFVMPSVMLFYEDAVLVCVENLGKIRQQDRPRQRPQVNVIRPLFEAYMVQRHIEDFFATRWTRLTRILRYFLAMAAFVGMIVAITEPAGRELPPLQKPEQFILRTDPILAAVDIHKHMFNTSKLENKMEIDIIWGVEGIDKSGTWHFEPENIGTLQRDEQLGQLAAKEESQAFLLQFCDSLRKSNLTHSDAEIRCWIEDFRDYVLSRSESFPISDNQKFYRHLTAWAGTETGQHYFENRDVYLIDGALAFFKIHGRGWLSKDSPASSMQVEYDRWESFIQEQAAAAPEGLRKFFQRCDEWSWLSVEGQYLAAFKQIVTASLISTGVITLVGTLSPVLTIITMMCLCIVSFSVISIIKQFGWQIGITEVSAIAVAQPIAVEFILPLPLNYALSRRITRSERSEDTYRNMGVSILTFFVSFQSSSLFIFGGGLDLFDKCGTIIATTILLSFVASIVLFGGLVHACGPEKRTLLEWIKSKMPKRMKVLPEPTQGARVRP